MTKAKVRCPHCGSERLRGSHPRGVSEQIAYVLGVQIRRCSGCRARLLSLGSRVTRVDGETADVMTTAIPMMCLGAMASGGLLFWFILKAIQMRV